VIGNCSLVASQSIIHRISKARLATRATAGTREAVYPILRLKMLDISQSSILWQIFTGISRRVRNACLFYRSK
jgi:hypothetical protein